MSLIRRRLSARRVAANQANAQKSTGPKTAEGKARVALNAVQSGAYAKADHILRLIMRCRGEEPKDYEQLHQDLVDYWQPVGMEAMVVKAVSVDLPIGGGRRGGSDGSQPSGRGRPTHRAWDGRRGNSRSWRGRSQKIVSNPPAKPLHSLESITCAKNKPKTNPKQSH
jgi:hypothetical protein